MKTRNVMTLMASAAIVLVASVYVTNREKFDEAKTQGDMLFKDIEAKLEKADALEIVKSGKKVFISKGADGKWGVAERNHYAVDHDALKETFLNLASAKILEYKTSKPEFYDRLEVSEEKATKVLVKSGKETVVDMLVGKRTYEHSEPASFVRLWNQPQTLLVKGDFKTDDTPQAWLDKALMSIEGSRIARIDYVTDKGEKFSLSRKREGEVDLTFNAANKAGRLAKKYTLKAQPILNSAADALMNLKLKDVAQDSDIVIFKEPRATFTTFEGIQVSFFKGKKGDVPFYRVNVNIDDKLLAAAGVRAKEMKKDFDAAKVRKEAQDLQQKLSPWGYQFVSYKASKLEGTLENFIETEEDKKKKQKARPGMPGGMPQMPGGMPIMPGGGMPGMSPMLG